MSLQVIALVIGTDTCRVPTRNGHSFRGAKPTCRTQACTQVARRLRNAVVAQISLACAHDAPHPADRNRHHRRILEVGDANPDIDAFLDQVHNAIEEQQVGADPRIAPDEIADDRGNVAPADQRRSGDRELARWLAASGDQSVLRSRFIRIQSLSYSAGYSSRHCLPPGSATPRLRS
jgi:hypothetical protein